MTSTNGATVVAEGGSGAWHRVLDARATRIVLWVAAGLVLLAGLAPLRHMQPQVVRGDPGGPYGCDPVHVGDILGACVAGAVCAGALVVLAALIPAGERGQTAPWIYAATVSVIVLSAAVFLLLAVFGPNLAAHECLS